MRDPPIRVWVTRTEPGATRLANLLAAKGLAVFKAPVLRIAPISSLPPRGHFDLAVFVSEHAVAQAFANGWSPSAKVVAIGEAADDLLRRHGVAPCLPWRRSARGVIAALAKPPAHTLIVKGEGGRDDLQRWLRGQGAVATEWNVYRRLRNELALSDERIDAIIVASGEGLAVVGGHWFRARREPGVPLFVPSERIAALARERGFANVSVTGGANPETVAPHLLKAIHGKVGCTTNPW